MENLKVKKFSILKSKVIREKQENREFENQQIFDFILPSPLPHPRLSIIPFPNYQHSDSSDFPPSLFPDYQNFLISKLLNFFIFSNFLKFELPISCCFSDFHLFKSLVFGFYNFPFPNFIFPHFSIYSDLHSKINGFSFHFFYVFTLLFFIFLLVLFYNSQIFYFCDLKTQITQTILLE